MKRRIIMLTTDYLPNIGGVAAHVYHLSKAMQRLGHDVAIVNPIYSDSDTLETTVENDLRVVRAKFRNSANPFVRFAGRRRAALQGCKMAIEVLGDVDVIHQHDLLESCSAARSLSNTAAWVWTNHTSGFLKGLENRVRRFSIRTAYEHVGGIISVSNEILERTQTLWGERCPTDCIPNGVDAGLFCPGVNADRSAFGLENDDFVVLCPRRMVEKNGVLYLAQAVERFARGKSDVRWRFLFLGSDPVGESGADYIARVKGLLEPAVGLGMVRFLGNIPMAQMPALNATADVVVVPSLMEAVSLSALEAMATRKPLVATNVGGLPEIVKNRVTGMLVEPRDPEALADAIVALQQDSGLRSQIAEGGYTLAIERYTWDAIAGRTAAFYERVLAERSFRN